MTLACRDTTLKQQITFGRLTDIAPDEIPSHMSDARVAEHMSLLTSKRDTASVGKFVAVNGIAGKSMGAPPRLRAEFIDEVEYKGAEFLKYRLEPEGRAFLYCRRYLRGRIRSLHPKHESDMQVYLPICNTRQPPQPGWPRLYITERRIN